MMRCEKLAARLPQAEIEHADGTNLSHLMEESVNKVDLFLAFTESDEANLISCQLAKEAGAPQTIALVSKSDYQDLYKRQIALFEAAVAQAKDKLNEVQGQTLTAEQATQNVEAMKAAFEKAAADVNELAEVAQKANAGAFEIVKARAEEAVAEFKAAADKVSG